MAIEVDDVAEENKEVYEMKISMFDELNIFLQEQDPQQSQLECGFVSHIIKKEIQLFQPTKKRPENLDKLYRCLTTIRLTSVEEERAFSVMTIFANNLRNRLNDDTLSAMLVLRKFYRK